jgi:site-specific DNA recombinase
MLDEPNRPPKCATYCRVSTAKQSEEGTSLSTQAAACRRYAADHGYAIIEAHAYREVYSGAELWDRPMMSALRAAIRERSVDVVVCYAIDRLSRDPVHLGVVITEADHVGVAVEFVTEQLDDSPEGQLIRFVRGYAARVEREKARERTINRLKQFRGIATRYDKLAAVYRTHVTIASIVLWL